MNENGTPSSAVATESETMAAGPMSKTSTMTMVMFVSPSESFTRTATVYISESPTAPKTWMVELTSVDLVSRECPVEREVPLVADNRVDRVPEALVDDDLEVGHHHPHPRVMAR